MIFVNMKFRCADDTTLIAEIEEELKSLLMRVKKLAEISALKKLRLWYNCSIQSHHFMAKRKGK